MCLNIFFSVIIPVHNKLEHLDRCINSVLDQSYANFEIIIVDDVSSDGSYEKALKHTSSCVKVLRRDTPGPGGYAARNVGIKEAKYEWLCFLDADDEWKPNHLQNFYNAISTNQEINVFTSSYIFSDSRGQRPHNYYSRFKHEGSHIFDFERFLVYKPIWTSSLCVKSKVISAIGGFPEGRAKRGGDTETWLRLMYEERKGYWIDECSAIYHRDSQNMVTKSVAPHINDHILYHTIERILSFEKDKRIRTLLKAHWNSTAAVYYKNMSKTVVIGYNDFLKYYWLGTPFRPKILLYFLYSLKNGLLSNNAK